MSLVDHRILKGSINWLAAFDVVVVVTLLITVKQTLLPYSQLYAGPASTCIAMAVATLLLRNRGASWRSLGVRWPRNWFPTCGLTLLTMGIFIAATQLAGLIGSADLVDVDYGTRFDHVEGNLIAYLTIMVIVWTHGSFFEELLCAPCSSQNWAKRSAERELP